MQTVYVGVVDVDIFFMPSDENRLASIRRKTMFGQFCSKLLIVVHGIIELWEGFHELYVILGR